MSEQSTKRRKTNNQGNATATAGVPTVDSLPPELLQTMCGFLDVRTLCTARLVCTQFRDAASLCVHSFRLSVEELRSRPKTNFNNFPNLSRVTIYDVGQDDLPMFAQSPVADAVTHVEAREYLTLVPRHRRRNAAGSPRLPFPNLLSLTVSCAQNRGSPFPQTLRELTLQSFLTHQTPSLVARLTDLTCLRIDARKMRKPFQAVTALTALRCLEICSDLALAPYVAQLTLLTRLQFRETLWESQWEPPWPLDVALACLTRLHNLVHLGVGEISMSLGHQLLSNLGTFTKLRSLELGLDLQPEPLEFDTTWRPPFTQLTALRLEGGLLDAAILRKLNLDRLQDLSLSPRVKVGRDGLAALRRATGLTQLSVWARSGTGLSPEELGIALSRMPQLRTLSLSSFLEEDPFCFQAIGLLTELTKLQCRGRHVSNADLKACVGLKKLRVLSIVPRNAAAADGVTLEALVAVAKLPELTKFETNKVFWCDRLHLKDGIRAWLDAERHKKGWPFVEFVVLP